MTHAQLNTLAIACVSASLLWLPPQAHAEDPPVVEEVDVEGDEPLDLEAYSLEELLNSTVIVGSRRAERMSESPAIISVITDEDSRDYRPLTFYERLSMLPGIELVESFIGYTQPVFRGLLQSHYNNKSLFMINGHPLYAPALGSFYLEQAPEFSVDRLEVVRGPASSLYATNAYGGVMNLVTRLPTSDEPQAEVRVLGGSFATRRANVSFLGRAGEVDLYLFGDVSDSDGYPYVAKIDEDGVRNQEVRLPGDSTGFENDYMNVYGGARWDRTQLNLGYFQLHRDKFGTIPTIVSTGPRDLRGWLADLTTGLEFARGQELVGSLRYDGFHQTDDITRFPPVAVAPGVSDSLRILSHKAGADVSARLTAKGDRAHGIAGASLDYLSSPYYAAFQLEDSVDPATGEITARAGDELAAASGWSDTVDYVDLGLYANGDVLAADWLKIAGGALLNWNSNYGTMLAPRLNAVFPFSERVSLKLLYGRSYRAPSIFEQSVSVSNIIYGGNVAASLLGGDNLQPEALDSIESAVEWRPGRVFLRAGAYSMWTSNLIERGAIIPAGSDLGNTADTPAYSNNPGQQLTGVELEMVSRLSRQLHFFANASGRIGWDDEGERLPSWSAPVLANAGGVLTVIEQIDLVLTGQFIGPRSGEMQGPGDPKPRSVEFDPYTLLNARIACYPDDNFSLSIAAKNLLNTSYSYPETIRQAIDAIPGGPGIQVYGEVGLRL